MMGPGETVLLQSLLPARQEERILNLFRYHWLFRCCCWLDFLKYKTEPCWWLQHQMNINNMLHLQIKFDRLVVFSGIAIRQWFKDKNTAAVSSFEGAARSRATVSDVLPFKWQLEPVPASALVQSVNAACSRTPTNTMRPSFDCFYKNEGYLKVKSSASVSLYPLFCLSFCCSVTTLGFSDAVKLSELSLLN